MRRPRGVPPPRPTEHELEVLAAAAALGHRAAADHLGLSVYTVGNTLSRLYVRLGVDSPTGRGGRSMIRALRVLGWLRIPGDR